MREVSPDHVNQSTIVMRVLIASTTNVVDEVTVLVRHSFDQHVQAHSCIRVQAMIPILRIMFGEDGR